MQVLKELALVISSLSLSWAITTSSLSRTAGLTDCINDAHWFTQPIDHFGDHNGTFQQKFFVETKYYRPGGPILLYQGEETKYLYCINSTIMYDFAKELNGIVVNLEHRYFGESVLFGSNLTEYSPAQWKYLTLDNVMQDAVTFIESVRTNLTKNGSTPVFAAAGSYGGFLMTMFRQNHPDAFNGVIASSPALRAFYGGDQTDVPGQYNWWNYASKVYQRQSALAATKISNAFAALAERFANNDIDTLQSELGLCNPVTNNSTETLQTLSTLLAVAFSNGAEFNYNVAKPGWTAIANPLHSFIDLALREENLLQIINRTNWIWNSNSAAIAGTTYTCFNQSNGAQLAELAAPILSIVPFDYIVCTYLQFDSSSIPNGTIFLPSSMPGPVHAATEQYCREKYSIIGAPTPTQLYERYHFTDAELQNSTGIIFSLGEYDPARSISGDYLFNMPLRAGIYASTRILTTEMAHREDLFAQDENTKQTVRHTNQIELETIKGWMKLA